MDKDFKNNGLKVLDWLESYYKNIEKLPVRSKSKPGEIKGKIAKEPPLKGEDFKDIYRDFDEKVMPGITHWQHPSFFAYFPSNTSTPSIMAELLSSGLGINSMLWETSPAATELEERMMNWLKGMIGLPKEFCGVIQDTASSATLCSLISAREKTTDFNINEEGFYSSKKLRIYVSDQGHSSILKGAKIAGFGSNNVVCVETDQNFAMNPDSLRELIKKDIALGFKPTCCVATVGTTSSTAIDPIDEIGKICSEFNVWFHVDAALAGTAAILPEKREILNGVEYCDSFVFNPHKWLFTNFDCSAYFVKNEDILRQTFSVNPEYLKTKKDDEVRNYRDYGIALGRRFRALKLWFVIRTYGVEGLREKIRNHIKWAAEFASWVDESENFERLAPVPLNLICFRYNPKGKDLGEEELKDINKKLMNELNDSGNIYLTHTELKGKYVLRMSIGQTNTKFEHVKNAWENIKTMAEKI